MKNSVALKVMVFLIMVMLVAGSRTLPHPPNFTPVMAIALFCGAVFGSRLMAYVIPLGAMLVSDFFIGFHALSGVIYLSMIPAILFGSLAGSVSPVGERSSFFGLKWFGLGFLADLSFFIMSNTALWWLFSHYEHSFQGLMECFAMALPFLLNQVLGTGTFLGLLLFTWYGLKVLAEWRKPSLQYQKYKR